MNIYELKVLNMWESLKRAYENWSFTSFLFGSGIGILIFVPFLVLALSIFVNDFFQFEYINSLTFAVLWLAGIFLILRTNLTKIETPWVSAEFEPESKGIAIKQAIEPESDQNEQ